MTKIVEAILAKDYATAEALLKESVQKYSFAAFLREDGEGGAFVADPSIGAPEEDEQGMPANPVTSDDINPKDLPTEVPVGAMMPQNVAAMGAVPPDPNVAAGQDTSDLGREAVNGMPLAGDPGVGASEPDGGGVVARPAEPTGDGRAEPAVVPQAGEPGFQTLPVIDVAAAGQQEEEDEPKNESLNTRKEVKKVKKGK